MNINISRLLVACLTKPKIVLQHGHALISEIRLYEYDYKLLAMFFG